MINYNGTLTANTTELLDITNRGFNYGDAIFETVKMSNGKLLFWEDHYFRLMASMRIMRMEIPMNFTLEFFEEEIHKFFSSSAALTSARIKIVVYRKGSGLYTPDINDIGYLITLKPLENAMYELNTDSYLVDLYKDNYIAP